MAVQEVAVAEPTQEHPKLDCRTCGTAVLLVDVTDPPATNVCFGPYGPEQCNTRAMRVRVPRQAKR